MDALSFDIMWNVELRVAFVNLLQTALSEGIEDDVDKTSPDQMDW